MRTGNQKTTTFTSSKIPFFILLFFCFASAILGDSIAEALILSHFKASVIPRMYMVNALFLFLSSLFVMSLIDRTDRGKFFLLFMSVHTVILFITWGAVSFGITFLYIPLFSYSYVTKIFIFLLFWTLANDIIDSRKAGKEFPFIAAGGTLGAICISFTIPWLLKVISAQSLLLVWLVLSFAVIICFIPIRKSFGKYFMQVSDSEKHVKRNLKSVVNDISLIRREPLLANMSLLYFLLFFILLNQQYTFYEAIKARFVEADRLAGFLGYFNGVSMGATFLLQLTLSGIIIKKIGSTRSMFMLPAVLCLVFGTLSILSISSGSIQNSFTIVPLLFWGIAGGVGLRIAFFDSFFSPNFQIFFSSLPQEIRGRGKLAIEGVVKPLAMVFAGLWLLFVTSNMPFYINIIVLFVLSICMIIQTFRIRSSYTESLTQYLGDFKSRVSLSLFDASEVSSSENMVSFLSEKMQSESYEIKCYIIEILTNINTEESIKILTDNLYKADKKVRSTIITSLTRLKREELKPLFKLLLRDEDERVIANSIFALAAYNDKEINEGLRAFLNHVNNRVRANTVIALWPVSDASGKKRLFVVLENMLNSNKSNTCASALFALCEIQTSEHSEVLLNQFYTGYRDVIHSDRRLWYHFLHALGKTPVGEIIEALLANAGNLNKKMRNDIVTAITEACANGYDILGRIRERTSAGAITRGILLKAFSMLRKINLKKKENVFIAIADEEAESALVDWASYYRLTRNSKNAAANLLSSAIHEECISDHLNNLILIAAILDTSGQVKAVMRRLNHDNKHVRARALEVLDNTGNMKVNRLVIKLIEINDQAGKVKEITDRASREDNDISSLINGYTTYSNQWVRECAAYAGNR